MTKRKKLLQFYQISKHLKRKKIILFYQYNNVTTRDWGLLRGELLNDVASYKPVSIPSSLLLHHEMMQEPGGTSTLKAASFPRTPSALSSHDAEPTEAEASISTLVVKSKIGQFCLAQTLSTLPTGASRSDSILTMLETPIRTAGEKESKGVHVMMPEEGNKISCAELLQGPTFLFACNSHREMVAGYKVIGKKRDRHNNNHALLLGGIYYGKVVTHLDIAKLSTLNSSIYASLPIALEEKVVSLLAGGLSYYQEELMRCLEYHRDNLLRGTVSTHVK